MKEVVVRPPLGDDTPSARLLYGADVRESLRLLDAESTHCVATSPPYWGLRDYGEEGQLGQEDTPDAYVDYMVEVFREVRRVLRSDGTLWVNLGDSYAANRPGRMPRGLKPKDLVGIPWRVASALQAEGWWLRNAIIWHKANHMPSPVQDRFTRSYEFIFLFSKSERYFFDLDAVRVPHTGGECESPGGKNPGDVWVYPTQPLPGVNVAEWPVAIPERIIRAATRERDPKTQTRSKVLDPFSGSGTTGHVALRLNRDYVGIDSNETYLDMAVARVRDDPQPATIAPPAEGSALDIFGED